MLTSSSSSVSRTPTPPSAAAERERLAPVVDLAAFRAPAPPDRLHITPALLAALGGPPERSRGRRRRR